MPMCDVCFQDTFVYWIVIKLINEFLDSGNQAVLEKEFKQMYPDMNSYWTPVVREII